MPETGRGGSAPRSLRLERITAAPTSRTSIASKSSQPFTTRRHSACGPQMASGGAARFRVLHQGLAADHSHGRQSHLPAFAVPDSRRTSGIPWAHSARRIRSGRRGNGHLKSQGLLEARVVLFQCPKSFIPTTENLTNFSAFFRRVERGSFRLAWEPRGEAWTEDVVRELCVEHDLIHCVDPFEAVSVHGDMRYWRLHGRGSYSYRYTDADLAALGRMLAKSPQPGYLMFNNFSSKADAQRFRQLF